MEAHARTIRGFDRHPWAIAAVNWSYRQFHADGRAIPRDIVRIAPTTLRPKHGTGIIAAYTANELTPDGRALMLSQLLEARERGASILVIEPIARRFSPVVGRVADAVPVAEPTTGGFAACCRPRSEPWHAPPALTLAS